MIDILDSSSFNSISRLFSTASLRRVVRENDTNQFDYCLSKHVKFGGNPSYGETLNYLYSALEKNYRSEYIFKNSLLNKKLLGKYSLKTTTVLDEFKIGCSIADFLLLNGEAKLFEIKTDLDSFDKLEKQISDYQKFAEKVYVVVGNGLVEKALDFFENTTVGVIHYGEKGSLKDIKKAERNTNNLSHETIFKTLRKNEYLSVLKRYFGSTPDVPNTKIFKESLKLAQKIDVLEFQKLAIKKLKERKLICPDKLKSDKTPKELKHLCYSLNLSEKDYDNLYHFLNRKVSCTYPT